MSSIEAQLKRAIALMEGKSVSEADKIASEINKRPISENPAMWAARLLVAFGLVFFVLWIVYSLVLRLVNFN